MEQALTPRVTVLLAHAQRLSGWNHERLAAPHWRLYWNRRAGAAVELDGQSTPIEPGHVMVIPPETPFCSRLKKPVDHLYFHFVLEPTGLTESAVLTLPASRDVQKRAEALLDGFLSNRPGTVSMRLECMAFIQQALARVPEKWLQPPTLDPRVAAAIVRMERDLSVNLRNDLLAKEAHMNTNAFIRLFSQQTGMGPQAYMTTKQIERACGMLHSPSVSIKEIAEATGFCDRYHFTRVFHKLRGLPPAEFRRRVCRLG